MCRFESGQRYHGTVAQRSEQATHNRLVEGSNPSGPTNFFIDLLHLKYKYCFAGSYTVKETVQTVNLAPLWLSGSVTHTTHHFTCCRLVAMALALGASDREFESLQHDIQSRDSQVVRRKSHKLPIGSSILPPATTF
jgi:hypothetical protein